MQHSSKTYSDYLERTRVLFANIEKHPEIKTKIAEAGYSDARLAEGSGLRKQFEDLYRLHLEKYQDRLAAYERVRDTRITARIAYGDLVNRLRVEFRTDPETRAELGLNGKRLQTKTGFIEQSTHFYNAASTHVDIQAKIQALGLTPESIQAAADTLTAYQTELEGYESLKGECQQLIVDRDQAFKTFRNWITAFTTTCRSLFRDNPQTLEKLNIFVRNSKPKKPAEEEPAPDTGTDTNTDTDTNTGTDTNTDTNTEPIAA
jgi:hypothetical protein